MCRDDGVAAKRFLVDWTSLAGAIVTRTGRPFFNDAAQETALLAKLRDAINATGLWDELGTDWLVLDCELLPWSAKAGELLRGQYAPVGVAATATLAAELAVMEAAASRGVAVDEPPGRRRGRLELAERFVEAYRRYCWTVGSVDDLRLAPFQVLAGEGKVHALTSHSWHLEVIGRLCDAAPGTLRQTVATIVDLSSEESKANAVEWWETLTSSGGEGMVVKPLDVVHRGRRGIAQPGVKCRGPEYLRIIYGPEYTDEQNLSRLRARGLGHKRSLALREFALGIEALERFVAGEPLYRVHECVFGVLALESEPVDPRL